MIVIDATSPFQTGLLDAWRYVAATAAAGPEYEAGYRLGCDLRDDLDWQIAEARQDEYREAMADIERERDDSYDDGVDEGEQLAEERMRIWRRNTPFARWLRLAEERNAPEEERR